MRKELPGPPQPRRGRGRPKVPFFQDKDRYILAFAVAMANIGAKSERGAVELAVAILEGEAVAPNLTPGWGHGLNLLDAVYKLRRERSHADSIENRARHLRAKLKAVRDPAAEAWLRKMGLAWMLTLMRAWARENLTPESPGTEALILKLAAAANEVRYAFLAMLPIATGITPTLGSQRLPDGTRRRHATLVMPQGATLHASWPP